MHSVDQMAYASPLRHFPPVSKLLFSLALLGASILSPTPLVPFIVLIFALVLLYYSSNFNFPALISFACMNTFIMLALSVAIVAFTTGGAPIFSLDFPGFALHLSREGANLGALVFLRAAAGFCVLLTFATSTPLPHLFFALRQIGLPDHVCELTVLVYRYSFMLLEQLSQMLTAAECRLGFSSPRRALGTLSVCTGNLFARSMDFAERAQNALSCRNYSGQFGSLRKPSPMPASHALAICASFILLAAIGQIFSNVAVF